MRTSSAASLALLALCMVAGCAGGGGDEDGRRGPACRPQVDPDTISFRSNIQELFTRSCALGGCHDAATRAQNLTLSSGAAHRAIVGRRSTQRELLLVRPGDPDASYLVRKIEGGPGISGVLMPSGCPGAPQGGAVCLSADGIEAVRTWILACAPNN
jgi:hypothetical protein